MGIKPTGPVYTAPELRWPSAEPYTVRLRQPQLTRPDKVGKVIWGGVACLLLTGVFFFVNLIVPSRIWLAQRLHSFGQKARPLTLRQRTLSPNLPEPQRICRHLPQASDAIVSKETDAGVRHDGGVGVRYRAPDCPTRR